MNTYLSTFISGVSSIVEEELAKLFPDVEILHILDGLVVYKTKEGKEKVEKIGFFNNNFILVSFIPKFANLNDLTQRFMKNPQLTEGIKIPSVFRTARVRFYEENQPISIPTKKEEELEEFIKSTWDLQVDRTNPDTEIWFSIRREGQGFIGILLKKENLKQEKGELRSELSYLLCLLSDPQENDIFLDPFAGYGAIPRERTKFPSKKVIASDKDSGESISIPEVEVYRWSMPNIPLENETVNKIVTDPPWGYFEERSDLEELYRSSLIEFDRILVKGGIIVVLTGQKELFEAILDKFPQFDLQNKYDILVSGKKAGIYKIFKLED
jgi:tRNA (guanine6-N2)-methyltransferase